MTLTQEKLFIQEQPYARHMLLEVYYKVVAQAQLLLLLQYTFLKPYCLQKDPPSGQRTVVGRALEGQIVDQ